MYNKQKTWVRVMAIILAAMMVVGILAGALYSIFWQIADFDGYDTDKHRIFHPNVK